MLLGERIRELRREKQLTQKLLAEELNVTQQAIAKWENGHSEPSLGTIITLAEFFNCSIDYLVGKSDMKLPREDNDGMLGWEFFNQYARLPEQYRLLVKQFFEFIKYKSEQEYSEQRPVDSIRLDRWNQ